MKLDQTLKASRIALGCMRMAKLSEAEADKVVHTAVENGINFFDHADIYGGGNSEVVFAGVLKRDPSLRGKILVQDKVGICKGYYDASKKHILEAADGCLERLGLEHIDVLLVHRPDALMEPEEVAEAFEQRRAQGKVSHFGVSNMNPAQRELLAKYMGYKPEVDQIQFGPVHTAMVDEGINVNTETEYSLVRTGGVLDYCRLNDILIQAWSPLQHGFFKGTFVDNPDFPELNAALGKIAEREGVSKSAVAIAWILRHPAHMQVIIGTMNPQHIREACDACKVELSHHDWYELYLASGKFLP